MAKRRKSVARRSSSSHNPLQSPVVQIGIVFIMLCAFFLMFYAGKNAQMYTQ